MCGISNFLALYNGLIIRVSFAITSLHIARTAFQCVSYNSRNLQQLYSLHSVSRLVIIMWRRCVLCEIRSVRIDFGVDKFPASVVETWVGFRASLS
jgi:hypothetical protein